MDKVIVTGLLVIGAITAAVMVIMTIVPTIGSSTRSVVESQKETARRIETSIEVIAVSPTSTGQSIDAWVKNVGVSPIEAIDKSDVFLIKPGTRYDVMRYSTGGTTKTWFGDLKEQGKPWNRGDTLLVTINLLGGDVLTAGEYVLRFSTPNAITAEKSFSFGQ